MASDPRNERRGNRPIEVRAEEEFKARLRAGAHNTGTDISKVTKQLWSWWLRDTDELPERPKETAVTTTTEYGSWGSYVMSARVEDTVEDTVADYLGEYADDYDVEALTVAFRDEIDQQLADIKVTLHGSEFYGPYQKFEGYEDRIKAAIEAVDLGELSLKYEND